MVTQEDSPSDSPETDLRQSIRRSPTPSDRLVAFFEVLLCSGYPTQITLAGTLIILGVVPEGPDGQLTMSYVMTLSLVDTVMVLGLVLLFLSAHHERPRPVLFGTRPLLPEVRAGIGLTFAAFLLAMVVLGLLQWLAPSLHTVEQNPLRSLMETPRDAALFAIVVVVAGGVREEIQRAFLLHRFEGWLGGRTTGVVVTSVLFGAGHLPQGLDASIVTALLGAFWAVVFLRRRSVMAPIVSHAGFNLLQMLQFMLIGR